MLRGKGRLAALALAAGLLFCTALSSPAAHAEPGAPRIDLTAEEQAFVDTCGVLRVGYVQDRIPVSFTGGNGELAGISRDIFDRVQALSGLQFEYVPLPGGAVTFDYLMGENIRLVTSVEYNAENKAARGICISEPYLSTRKVVVARPGLTFDYDAPLTVALSSGSQTIHKVLAADYPNFTLRDYDTIEDCFSAVARGEADLMIQNQYVVEYWISKPAYEGLTVIPVLGLDDQMCFSAVFDFTGAGAPTEADGTLLVGILDKAIAAISEDEVGSYIIRAVMENQYHYTFGDFLLRYRFAVGIFLLAAAVITLLAVLLWRQRLRSLKAKADARAKGSFLSTMSHEIRTPLNGLIGLNYLMRQNLDDRGRLDGYLKQSTTTAQYLLSLVNDILDMSKLQDRKMELQQRPVDLALVVEAAASIERGGMQEKGIDFGTDTALPHPCVLGDEVRIQQVLMNLLDNARKFTPQGGRVRLAVTQTALPDGRVETRMEVTDTGRGMSEAFQKRAFQSFAQESDSVSKGNQGTGLGLPISRQLAELMGGSLTFTSAQGRGSCFVFAFPAQPVQPAAAPAALAPAPAGARPGILVAEDNDLNAEIMLDLLKEKGFAVDLARDGAEAVKMFSASPAGTYGVILMDLLMPNLDGFAAASAIRALDRPDAGTVRIIACTANSFAEDRKKALASGMDDFIAKPVDIDALLKKLGG